MGHRNKGGEMSQWYYARCLQRIHHCPVDVYAGAASQGVAPFAGVRGLIERGLLNVAQQPRNNALDLSGTGIARLYVFLIDHDYPGGSAAMHNAVFEAYNLPYRS